jgi:hypothetical protein
MMRAAFPVVALVFFAACQVPDAHPQTAQAPPPPYGPVYQQPPPPYGHAAAYQPPPAPPPRGEPLPSAPAPQAPPVAPNPPPGAATQNRPLLLPIVGPIMAQAEVRAVVRELEANLAPEQQQLVAGVPLVFDPSPTEINAFAGCDDSGAPFVASTEGLLEAIDGIAQTRATDELFGTRAYDAYTHAVLPGLVSSKTATAALPLNVIPFQYLADPRRLSRAHEMFDEIVAFTFGHELAHHYRGHTGCAHGQPAGVPPVASDLRRLASSAFPLVNQINENEADQWGCYDVLTTGKARASTGLRWTEEGGLWLFDFFARLDAAAGANPMVDFLRTHPSPGWRAPQLQVLAVTWRLQHPG